MFRIPPPGQNDIFEMGPGRGQVLIRNKPACLDGKPDEDAHEKKDDNEADVKDEPFPQLVFFLCRCRAVRHGSAFYNFFTQLRFGMIQCVT
jgi:hypothetical protein